MKNDRVTGKAFLNGCMEAFKLLDTDAKNEVIDELINAYLDEIIAQAEHQIEIEKAAGCLPEIHIGSPEDMKKTALYLIMCINNKGYNKQDEVFREANYVLWDVVDYFDREK